MQELEKNFPNSFELGNEMDTDDYVSCVNCSILFPSGSILHSHLHECSNNPHRKNLPLGRRFDPSTDKDVTRYPMTDYLLGPYDTGLTVYPSVMNSDSSQVPVKNPTARDTRHNPHEKSKARKLDGNFRFSSISLAHRWVRHKLYRYCPSHYLWALMLNPLRVEVSQHNGVTIYCTSETACRLSAVVDEFDIWGEKDRWMAISLLDESIEWPLYHIPSGYSVFVVYRHIPKTFCRVYVDERHLHTVFSKLKIFNICVNPRKTYLRFPSIQYLGQNVDVLSLSTPHGLMYGCQLNYPQTVEILRIPEPPPQALTKTPGIEEDRIEEDTQEALNFASVQMKKRYDTQHLARHFNVGDYVYLNLHRGYEIPQTKGLRRLKE